MIPLYKPFMPELPLLNEILYSGQLAYGKYGREFEKKLGEYIGNSQVIVTNSYNMATFVALTTLGLKPGDTVIASPMACLASNQPLITMGLKVKWVDIDPLTGTLCPDNVRKNLKFKPKAIFHNHFCGYIGYVDEINSIGAKYGIPVIDDCIEAFGSEYKGVKMGAVNSDITMFSFNPVRIPNTIDGGAIVFKDKELYLKSILIRDAGIDRSKFRDESGEINPECDISLPGYSATPSEVNSYIGIRQLEYVEKLIESQRLNAKKWDSLLKNDKDLKPIMKKDGIPNYWVYGILVNSKKEIIKEFRNKGFYASGVHLKNNIYSLFDDNSYLPGVDYFNDRFVALPCGWWMNENEIELNYGKRIKNKVS